MSEIRSVQIIDAQGRAHDVNLDDWRDHTLYSSIEIDTGATLQKRMLFFQYAQGQKLPQARGTGGALTIGRASTELDTNFPSTAGRLSSTRQFIWFSLWLEICALTDDDQTVSGVANVRAEAPLMSGYNLKWLDFASLLSLIFGNDTEKPYFWAPPSYWPPEQGVLGYTSGDNGAAGDGPNIAAGTMGMSGGRMLRRTLSPIHQDSRQKVVGALDFPRGETPELSTTGTPALTYTQAMHITLCGKGIGSFPVVGAPT